MEKKLTINFHKCLFISLISMLIFQNDRQTPAGPPEIKKNLGRIRLTPEKNKKIQQQLNAKGMTLDDVLRHMKKNRK